MTVNNEPNRLEFDDDDGVSFDDGFSYEKPEETAIAPEAEAAEYDDAPIGITAPEPMEEPEKKSKLPIVLGGAVAVLLAALVGVSVFAAVGNNKDEAEAPPATTPSVIVPSTVKVTETQKVPDTAGVKRVEKDLDSMRRDRDRYRNQVGSLNRQLAAAKNDATVAKKDASAAKTSRDSARDRANTLDSQLTTVKSDLKEANEQIKKLEAEIEELKTPADENE